MFNEATIRNVKTVSITG